MKIYVYLYLKHMLGVQIGNMVRLCVYILMNIDLQVC